jgi:electron transfer flavoprotein alpha/beta subunit
VIVVVCLESPRPSRASRAALDLAGSLCPNARLIAVTAGGPHDGASLALACATAAVGQVVHLADAALDHADFMTLGMVLAEAARHLEAGLVVTGERSDEEGQGLVPAALAHALHAPLLARALAVRPAQAADTVEVVLRSGGRRLTVAAPLPLVVSVPPRPDVAPAAAAGRLREIETWDLGRIGLAADRLVPRPELLGTLVPTPAELPHDLTLEEAAAALLRHH